MNTELIKQVTTLTIGFGTGKIVSGIIKNNVEIKTTADQVSVLVTSYVLGSMIAERTSEYTNEKIDKAAVWYAEHVQKKTA